MVTLEQINDVCQRATYLGEHSDTSYASTQPFHEAVSDIIRDKDKDQFFLLKPHDFAMVNR